MNSVGRLPDASATLDKLACWIRFSRWCLDHGSLIGRYRASGNCVKSNRYEFYDSVIQREQLDKQSVVFLEFGVYSGDSIAWWVNRMDDPDSRFIGFDTFTGLPEKWDGDTPLGTFSTGGRLPRIDDPRCSFQAGLFQETIARFLAGFTPKGRLVLHLDADLYSSTLCALTSLASLLQPDDLLFFDEFANPAHEFRAFDDFAKSFQLQFKLIGAVNNFNQVCFKMSSGAHEASNARR